MQLRLAIWVLLNTSPAGFFCLLAVVCTSFSAMNVATSKRSPCTPFGDTTLPHVRATCSHFFRNYFFPSHHVNYILSHTEVGNLLLSRSILLCYLAVCLNGALMLEQPSSSRLPWFPRWEQFAQMVKLWRVGWWMKHYGSLTPKLDVIIVHLDFFAIRNKMYIS